jgi:NADH:ubiquinone oxidoreductase subunit 3 (subunit A)
MTIFILLLVVVVVGAVMLRAAKQKKAKEAQRAKWRQYAALKRERRKAARGG